MTNEENIRNQYREHEQRFKKIRADLEEALQRVAATFYQQRRFKVNIHPPRIKTIDSVLNKMKKKEIISDSLFKRENNELSLVVNDFLGARISCNTREDVDEIKGLLESHRRFRLIKEEPLEKPSGYRALHLDMLYETYLDDDIIFIPVEIQIKTHLQTAWGDITHDESYKPENEDSKNEWEFAYSKHMADMLDTLDSMASTIRQQRISFVRPPAEISDSDININLKTLSYKVAQLDSKGELLTQQEMTLAIGRLKDEGFETIAEVWELLQDGVIESKIKQVKEELRNNENVRPFEMLYYGSMLKRKNEDKFRDEIIKDYKFVQQQCPDCNRLLTKDELVFMKEKTDSDISYFCVDHWKEHFPNECTKCMKFTAGTLCKNCEAETSPF
jgi:ppGpp synthetase/RelA/SpoT-type nucleotidyltranferase